MLFFAHLGLALAGARFMGRAGLISLALGSILPDLIDKPLRLIVPGMPGRSIAHTLLFFILLAVAAYNWSDLHLTSVSLGVFSHLALDFMWNSPQILFWPILGRFPVVKYMDAHSYFQTLFMELGHTDALAAELAGAMCIVVLVMNAWANNGLTMRDHLSQAYGIAQMQLHRTLESAIKIRSLCAT